MTSQPITIPVDEPSEEEKARQEQLTRQSELIDEVLAELRTEVDWAYEKLNQASDQDSTDHLTALAGALGDLAAKASQAASRLTAAGIGETVHSIQACRNVSNHAGLAASDALEAANADSATPTHFKLQSARDQMAVASSVLRGA